VVLGEPLSARSASFRQRLGYVPERPHIPGSFTVERLEALGRQAFPYWDSTEFQGALERFHISRTEPMYRLSQGQRTLTALAYALAHHAEILLLDEPTNGLDPLVRRDFLANLIEASYDEGRTVIVSSHRLEEIELIAQDIAILHHGALIESGPLEALILQDRVVSFREEGAPIKSWGALIPGAGQVVRQEKQVSVYVRGFDDRAVRDALTARGVAACTPRHVSLDEFFEERVRADAG
jgi:ABC-2 type transport system ATP-binding protein